MGSKHQPVHVLYGKISHRPAVIWRIYLLLCLSDVHFVVISSAQLPIHCGANIWFILKNQFISADKYWVKPISPRSPQRLHDLHVTMTPPSRRKSLILHARCLTPFPRPIWEFCEVVPKCAAVGNPNDPGRGKCPGKIHHFRTWGSRLFKYECIWVYMGVYGCNGCNGCICYTYYLQTFIPTSIEMSDRNIQYLCNYPKHFDGGSREDVLSFFLSSHLGVSAVGSPAALRLRFCIAELITSYLCYLNWAFWWWDDYRWLIEVNTETAQCRVIRVRSMTTLLLKACPAVKQLGWLAVSLAKRAVPQDRWAWWPNHQTRAEQGQNSSNIFGDHMFDIFVSFSQYIVLFSGWDVVGCFSSVIYHSHLAHL